MTGFIVKGLDLDLRGAGTTPIEEQLQQQVHAAKATALQAAQQEAIEQAERGGRLRARNSALEARLAALTETERAQVLAGFEAGLPVMLRAGYQKGGLSRPTVRHAFYDYLAGRWGSGC